MPENARPSTLWMSSSMIFHSQPRLRRSVSQASGSSSTAAAWANPACSSPRDGPPAPAQISRQVSPPTVPPAPRTMPHCARRRQRPGGSHADRHPQQKLRLSFPSHPTCRGPARLPAAAVAPPGLRTQGSQLPHREAPRTSGSQSPHPPRAPELPLTRLAPPPCVLFRPLYPENKTSWAETPLIAGVLAHDDLCVPCRGTGVVSDAARGELGVRLRGGGLWGARLAPARSRARSSGSGSEPAALSVPAVPVTSLASSWVSPVRGRLRVSSASSAHGHQGAA